MRVRLHRSNGSMAEFAPAFCILIAALFPLIDLLGLGMSVGTAHFINSQAAQKASVAGNPANALDAMFEELNNSNQSNFSKFANLNVVMPRASSKTLPPPVTESSPPPNYSTMLYVVRTNIANSASGTEYTQAPPPDQFDPNTYIYEYYVLTTFQANPFINLGAIPGLSAIPGLGQPFDLRIASTRAIESTEPFDPNQSPAWATANPGIVPGPGSGASWFPGLPH